MVNYMTIGTKKCKMKKIPNTRVLIHWGQVTQICVFTLQLCKTD